MEEFSIPEVSQGYTLVFLCFAEIMSPQKLREKFKKVPLEDWSNAKLFEVHEQMVLITRQLREQMAEVYDQSNKAGLILEYLHNVILARVAMDKPPGFMKEFFERFTPDMNPAPPEFHTLLAEFLPSDFPEDSRTNTKPPSLVDSTKAADQSKGAIPKIPKAQSAPKSVAPKKDPIPSLLDLKINPPFPLDNRPSPRTPRPSKAESFRPPNPVPETPKPKEVSKEAPLSVNTSTPQGNDPSLPGSESQLTPNAQEFQPRSASVVGTPMMTPGVTPSTSSNSLYSPEPVGTASHIVPVLPNLVPNPFSSPSPVMFTSPNYESLFTSPPRIPVDESRLPYRQTPNPCFTFHLTVPVHFEHPSVFLSYFNCYGKYVCWICGQDNHIFIKCPCFAIRAHGPFCEACGFPETDINQCPFRSFHDRGV